jgi:hypothetical protein
MHFLHLNFVRCEYIFALRNVELARVSLPSLGVSSLDLGHQRWWPFFWSFFRSRALWRSRASRPPRGRRTGAGSRSLPKRLRRLKGDWWLARLFSSLTGSLALTGWSPSAGAADCRRVAPQQSRAVARALPKRLRRLKVAVIPRRRSGGGGGSADPGTGAGQRSRGRARDDGSPLWAGA